MIVNELGNRDGEPARCTKFNFCRSMRTSDGVGGGGGDGGDGTAAPDRAAVRIVSAAVDNSESYLIYIILLLSQITVFSRPRQLYGRHCAPCHAISHGTRARIDVIIT